MAQRIAIIDHGRIVAEGTSQALKQQTDTDTLEQAFLKLTGTAIRDEQGAGVDQMRAMAAMWRGKRRS
jgi:ABC-2 type transport system ATP-binding protein